MVVYRHSVIFNAPIKFVYNWWTDYREDDPQFTVRLTGGSSGIKLRKD